MLIMPRDILLTWADEERANRRPVRERAKKTDISKQAHNESEAQELVAHFEDGSIGKLV
jgi:hypothetical protein